VVPPEPGDWLNGFKNGKTQQFNFGGVVKLAYFQKKVEYPFNFSDKYFVETEFYIL